MKKILKIILIIVLLIILFFIELIKGARMDVDFGMETELPSNVLDY